VPGDGARPAVFLQVEDPRLLGHRMAQAVVLPDRVIPGPELLNGETLQFGLNGRVHAIHTGVEEVDPRPVASRPQNEDPITTQDSGPGPQDHVRVELPDGPTVWRVAHQLTNPEIAENQRLAFVQRKKRPREPQEPGAGNRVGPSPRVRVSRGRPGKLVGMHRNRVGGVLGNPLAEGRGGDGLPCQRAPVDLVDLSE